MDWILIVEDDELIAELERDYLLAEGMGSDIVSDGCEAVMQFRKRKYAAVLLDLMLPGKSGFDICREIRAQSDAPILLVTAKKEDIDKIKGLGLGADDYVVKPFSPLELTARVKAHMHIHSTLKEEGKEKMICADRCAYILNHTGPIRVNSRLNLKEGDFSSFCFLCRIPTLFFQGKGSLTGSGVTKPWETCRLLRCM